MSVSAKAASRDALIDYIFDASGYIKHDGYLDPHEVSALRDLLTCSWEQTRGDGILRVRNLAGASQRFARMAVELATELQLYRFINQPFRLTESYALHRTAGSAQDLHNGFSEPQVSAWGSSSRTMWRHHTYHDGKTYCMMVKVLVYLSTIASDADGPFCLIEGSHKSNYPLPIAPASIGAGPPGTLSPSVRVVSPRAGDVIILNEALMHGTYPKTSSDPRIVLAFSYAPKFVGDYTETPCASERDIWTSGYYV